MKQVTDPAILAQLNADGAAARAVTDPAILAQLNGEAQAQAPTPDYTPKGPPPGFMDRVIGSPLGRLAHDVVLEPAAGLASLAAGAAPIIGNPVLQGMVRKGFDTVIEQPYQNALAANRNAPGYADARKEADAVRGVGGGAGLADQAMAPFLPALSGIGGGLFGGSIDASMAAADAQSAAMGAYRERNPAASFGAGLIGGIAAGGPQSVASAPARLPAYAIPRTPERAAADYIERIMRGAGVDTAALRAAPTGKPITAAEAIGKPGEVALGALARRDGLTAGSLEGMALERAQTAPSRMLDDFAQAGGISPEAARGDIDAFVAAGRTKAAPAYEVAYSQPAVITDRLQQFAREPIVQAGMKEGVKIERLKALADGRPFDPNAYAITGWDAAGEPIIGAVPTWKTWDAAKTGIDDMLAVYRDKNTGRFSPDKKGMAIDDVRKAMLKEVDSVNPAYKEARGVAGDYLSASEAFQQGGKFLLDPKITEKQFVDTLGNMPPANQEAFKGGLANRIYDMAQNGNLNPKLFASDRVREKLGAVFGKDNAGRLLSDLQSEARMAAFSRTQAPGAGSGTQGWRAAMDDQDGASSMALDAVNVAGDMAQRGLVPAMSNYVLNKGRNAAAAYATRGMGLPVRDAAGEMLMLPPAELANRLTGLRPIPQPPLIPLAGPRAPLAVGLFGSGLSSQPLLAPPRQ